MVESFRPLQLDRAKGVWLLVTEGAVCLLCLVLSEILYTGVRGQESLRRGARSWIAGSSPAAKRVARRLDREVGARAEEEDTSVACWAEGGAQASHRWGACFGAGAGGRPRDGGGGPLCRCPSVETMLARSLFWRPWMLAGQCAEPQAPVYAM